MRYYLFLLIFCLNLVHNSSFASSLTPPVDPQKTVKKTKRNKRFRLKLNQGKQNKQKIGRNQVLASQEVPPLSLAGFTLGIISLILLALYFFSIYLFFTSSIIGALLSIFMILFAIAGIILSAISISKEKVNAFNMVGLINSILTIVLPIIFFIVLLIILF